MSASSQAGFLAKQGFSMLYNATVTSVSAISSGINKAYKTYTDYHERDQIEKLRKSGKKPAEVLLAVLQRFHFLSMAGYNNEVAAAAQKVASKLTAAGEGSSVTLETVTALGRVLVDTCARYGDFSAGGWGLQDFLNSARMGKDHFDRDQLVNDLYFAILFMQDVAGGPGPEFERMAKEGARRMVEGDSYVGESGFGGSSAYTPASFGSTPSALPSYAQVPSAFGSSAASASGGPKPAVASAVDGDPKKEAAKVLNVVASSIKKAADDADTRRIRSLREAEDMLRREREKAATGTAGAVPAVPAAVPSFGGSSGFGGATSTGFGGASSTTSGYGATGFGGAPAAAAPAAANAGWANFGSGSSAGGFSGSSGGASAPSSGWAAFGSTPAPSGGYGSATTGGYAGGANSSKPGGMVGFGNTPNNKSMFGF